jgi:hypothetical protein
MAIGSDNRFEIGRVFERAFGVMGANGGVFAGLALLLGALPTAVIEIIQFSLMGGPAALTGQTTPTINPSLWLFSVVGGLISMGFTYTLQGAVTRGAVVSLNGGKASFSDCLQTGVQVFLPAIAIAILSGLGITLGLILLIVPGIILMLAWCVAIPVRVMERRGVTAALARSAELTRGHRGSLFLFFIVFAVVYFVLAMLIGAVFGAVALAMGPENIMLGSLLTQPILTAVVSIVSSSFVASIYYELRTIKEGVGSDTLAAVFD